MSASDFVVPKLRAKPVDYTVRIGHYVADGQWAMSVKVMEISEDRENRLRVAADLEAAAVMLRNDT